MTHALLLLRGRLFYTLLLASTSEALCLYAMIKKPLLQLPSPLERCPPEIQSRIFVLLCADGGRMGCVLRSLSKRVAAQSKPFRFWSVSISGTKQLEAFERTILKVGASLRRVQHLMISDKSGYVAGKPRTFNHDINDYLAQREDLYSGRMRLTIAERAQRTSILSDAHTFEQVFARVHGHIVAHLKTMSLMLFHTTYDRLFKDLSSRTFPRLTCFAFYSKTIFGGQHEHAKMMRMPALESLVLGAPLIASNMERWLRIFLTTCDELETIELRGAFDEHDMKTTVQLLLDTRSPGDHSLDIWALSGKLRSPHFPRKVDRLFIRSYNRHLVASEALRALDDERISVIAADFPDYLQLSLEWRDSLEQVALRFALE
jgi:hypothetical protein